MSQALVDLEADLARLAQMRAAETISAEEVEDMRKAYIARAKPSPPPAAPITSDPNQGRTSNVLPAKPVQRTTSFCTPPDSAQRAKTCSLTPSRMKSSVLLVVLPAIFVVMVLLQCPEKIQQTTHYSDFKVSHREISVVSSSSVPDEDNTYTPPSAALASMVKPLPTSAASWLVGGSTTEPVSVASGRAPLSVSTKKLRRYLPTPARCGFNCTWADIHDRFVGSDRTSDGDDLATSFPNCTLSDLPLYRAAQTNTSSKGTPLTAQLRSCDGSSIEFAPPAPATTCQVRILVATPPTWCYDDIVCKRLKKIPDGRIYLSVGRSMSHAVADYVLAEVLKNHPCSISAEEVDSMESLDGVVGLLPWASSTHLTGKGALKALDEMLHGNATLERIFIGGRLFAFLPAILSPPPFRRAVRGNNTHLNIITHEVGQWGRSVRMTRMKKRSPEVQQHLPRRVNLSDICVRHTVIPKFDWGISTPIPVADNVTSFIEQRPVLISFAGRSSTTDRRTLAGLSGRFPEEVKYVDASQFDKLSRMSVFCVDTTGDSLTTTRITNAVLRGCIPLLICDDCVFPFSKLYRYRIVNSPADAMVEALASPLHGEYPTFAVRLAQYSRRGSAGFVERPELLLEVARALLIDQRAIESLLAGIRTAQRVFQHPFKDGSHFIDTMLYDMAIGASVNRTKSELSRCPL